SGRPSLPALDRRLLETHSSTGIDNISKGEVTTLSDENSWSSNNLEFPDFWEAAHSVLELASRWRMVSNCRVIAA
ncbi:hypothetical protein, partial [Rhodococcus erythropolis]